MARRQRAVRGGRRHACDAPRISCRQAHSAVDGACGGRGPIDGGSALAGRGALALLRWPPPFAFPLPANGDSSGALMQQRQLRLGDILDDYCPRERRVTNHAVVAMIGPDVKQTRCTTCDTEHEYKHAKVPRQRRKAETPAALYSQVLAGGPKRVAHEEAGNNGDNHDAAQEQAPLENAHDAREVADQHLETESGESAPIAAQAADNQQQADGVARQGEPIEAEGESIDHEGDSIEAAEGESIEADGESIEPVEEEG